MVQASFCIRVLEAIQSKLGWIFIMKRHWAIFLIEMGLCHSFLGEQSIPTDQLPRVCPPIGQHTCALFSLGSYCDHGNASRGHELNKKTFTAE